MDELDHEAEPSQSRWLWPVVTILAIVLLAAAAYVGASYLGRPAQTGVQSIDFTPAKEIPQSEPELSGFVSSLEGDSLFVQEFSANDALGLQGGSSGVVVYQAGDVDLEDHAEFSEDVTLPDFIGGDGPVTEVVVTHNTQIYQDATFGNFSFEAEGGQGLPDLPDTIEQEVEIGSLDEIGTNSMVTVWGERRADRVIAEVILYQPTVATFIQAESP